MTYVMVGTQSKLTKNLKQFKSSRTLRNIKNLIPTDISCHFNDFYFAFSILHICIVHFKVLFFMDMADWKEI